MRKAHEMKLLFITLIILFHQTINRKCDDTSERTSCRIQSAALLFENNIDNFPSLWPVCLNVYKSLLFSPLNVEVDFKMSMSSLDLPCVFQINLTGVSFPLVRASSNDGFVTIMLALLDHAFKDTNNDDDANDNGFDSMMNFQQFEKVESEKCCVSRPYQRIYVETPLTEFYISST